MLNEAHTPRGDLPIRALIAKLRHDGCGGRAGRVELLTGIEGASSRPVRKIVLIDGWADQRGDALARQPALPGESLPGGRPLLAEPVDGLKDWRRRKSEEPGIGGAQFHYQK
jgi:hypothetical protein